MALPLLLLSVLASASGAAAAATLTLSSSSQIFSGQDFYVTVANDAPKQGDVLGLYKYNGPYASAAALALDISEQTAVRFWFPAQLDASYLVANTTVVKINLPNYRKDMFLVLFGAGTYAGTYGGWLLPNFILTASSPITQANPNELTAVHVTVVSVSSSSCKAAVQWTTRDSLSPQVQWARSPAKKWSTPIMGKSTTYTQSDMCGAPGNTTGWFEPGTLNYAYITLPLNTLIVYRVGIEATAGVVTWGQEYKLQTPPAPGKSTPVNIIWTADYGNAPADKGFQFGNDSPATVYGIPPPAGGVADPTDSAYWLTESFNMITGVATAQGSSSAVAAAISAQVSAKASASQLYNAMFISGDISYARGYQTQWDQFFLQNNATFGLVPVYVALGNHERNWPGTGDRFAAYPPLDIDSGGECGVSASKRFIQPPPFTTDPQAPTLPDTPWYSIDIGPVHYITYSSEHDVTKPTSAQYKWLAADLAKVDRSKTPWIIVGGHRPMQINSIDGVLPTSNLLVGEETLIAFEDLFFLHEVDLVLHGHHHSYQRTKQVYKRRVIPGAPVYIVAGNAGFEMTLLFQPTLPDYFENVIMQHGYLTIKATATKLITNMLSTTNTILDSVTLTKPTNYKPNPMHRRMIIKKLAGQGDFYTTKLISNYSLGVLGAEASLYVTPNLNAVTVGGSFLAFSKANTPGALAALLTNNINFPDTWLKVVVSWDYYVNYLVAAIKANNATVNADPVFNQTFAIMEANVAYAKTLL